MNNCRKVNMIMKIEWDRDNWLLKSKKSGAIIKTTNHNLSLTKSPKRYLKTEYVFSGNNLKQIKG